MFPLGLDDAADAAESVLAPESVLLVSVLLVSVLLAVDSNNFFPAAFSAIRVVIFFPLFDGWFANKIPN